MSKKKEINKGKGRTGYALAIIALIFGFLLAKKYYTFILLWGIIPFPITLGDRYVLLLDEPDLRIKSLILGIISVCVTLYFIRKIYKTKDGRKSLKLGFISLLISILFSLSFYVLAPSYTFKTYPQLFMYMDSKGEYIEKPAYYLWLVDKLGFYQETYRPFKTLDDAIQGLEFAKKRKHKGLYEKVFLDTENFDYGKVLDEYNDLTFQLYFLHKILYVNYGEGKYEHQIKSGEKFINNIRNLSRLEKSQSKTIQEVANEVMSAYYQYSQGKLSKLEFFKHIRDINFNLYERTQGVEGVEYSIF